MFTKNSYICAVESSVYLPFSHESIDNPQRKDTKYFKVNIVYIDNIRGPKDFFVKYNNTYTQVFQI